jgi:hypothetical protein
MHGGELGALVVGVLAPIWKGVLFRGLGLKLNNPYTTADFSPLASCT